MRKHQSNSLYRYIVTIEQQEAEQLMSRKRSCQNQYENLLVVLNCPSITAGKKENKSESCVC